jgi:hypothetical protein
VPIVHPGPLPGALSAGTRRYLRSFVTPSRQAGASLYNRRNIAHSESPFVTVTAESAPGSGRFEQVAQVGPYTMAVVIEMPSEDVLTSAWWWWSLAGETPTEQSKASASLARNPN